MGDAAIAFGRKEEHLRFPAIGCERPALAESDGLTRSPVLVADLCAVLGGESAHGVLDYLA